MGLSVWGFNTCNDQGGDCKSHYIRIMIIALWIVLHTERSEDLNLQGEVCYLKKEFEGLNLQEEFLQCYKAG